MVVNRMYIYKSTFTVCLNILFFSNFYCRQIIYELLVSEMKKEVGGHR